MKGFFNIVKLLARYSSIIIWLIDCLRTFPTFSKNEVDELEKEFKNYSIKTENNK